MDAGTKPEVDMLRDEYGALKTEQLQRIANRNNLLYATLGVIAVVGYGAIQVHQPLLLLALTPAGAILGWMYLCEDRRNMEIGHYIAADLDPRMAKAIGHAGPVWRWESGHIKGRSLRRRLTQLVVDLAAFVVPGLVGLGVAMVEVRSAWIVPAALIDSIVAANAIVLIVAHAELRRKASPTKAVATNETTPEE